MFRLICQENVMIEVFMTEFYEKLLTVSKESHIKTKEEMRKHTTFRVGGPAAYFVTPKGEEELKGVVSLCQANGVEYFILGNGSNLLVGDDGFDGVVISMTGGFSFCEADSETGFVRAGAGASLARVAKAALERSLTGLEFAAGIPGTLGGAVVMNAGAYGSEIKDVLKYARIMTPEGEIKQLSQAELELGYRTSAVIKNRYIVLEAGFCLKPGDQEAIRAYMEELAGKRKSRQPLEYPSAGSTFKRPAGNFAGKLIEEAGLRGYTVGGAQVSEKHCGFVVNRDHATASDIFRLCGDVKKRVFENSGVELEMEVKTLGKFRV